MIKLKRVYGPPSGQDGFRVLVDQLWPRGMRKEDAAGMLAARVETRSIAVGTRMNG